MNSIWPPALASLDESLTLSCESLGKLDAAISVDIPSVAEQFEMAAESARMVRELVSSELPGASWETRAELDAHIETIRKIVEARTIEQTRARLLALAAELERGNIVHRRAVRVTELNQLRDQAINELRSKAESEEAPRPLPGPDAGQWVEWACALKEPEDTESLQSLRNGFARLDDFIANLEPGMWSVPDPALALLEAETRKARLLALATELERGSIVHHRAFRVTQLNQLRDQAVNELRSQAESTGTQTLPGPEIELWIEWACALKEPEDAEALETLRSGFAQLDDFITNLEPDMWRPGSQSAPETPPATAKPADLVRQEQPVDSSGFEETILSSGPLPIKLKATKTSRREWRASHAKEATSTAVRSDTVAPDNGRPAVGEDEAQPKEAVLTSMKALVTEPVRRLKNAVEPPFTAETSLETGAAAAASPVAEPSATAEVFRKSYPQPTSPGIGSRMQEVVSGKSRMLVAVAAVVLIMVVGGLWWRSRRNHSNNNTVKASESTVVSVAPTAPDNSGQYQSALPIDVTKQAVAPDKQAKIKDQPAPAANKPNTPATPDRPAGRPEDAVLQPPPSISNNPPKNQEVASNNAPEAPAILGSLPRNVPNTVINSIPVAQPKLAQKVTVSSGVAQGLLIHQVTPRYPSQARQAHVQGTVVLQALIGKDGSVRNLHAVSGHPMLTQAAMDAVKQWRYKPYYLDGQPVEAETQINVKFNP